MSEKNIYDETGEWSDNFSDNYFGEIQEKNPGWTLFFKESSPKDIDIAVGSYKKEHAFLDIEEIESVIKRNSREIESGPLDGTSLHNYKKTDAELKSLESKAIEKWSKANEKRDSLTKDIEDVFKKNGFSFSGKNGYYDTEIGTVRIKDHAQKPGGGYHVEHGQMGNSDISIFDTDGKFQKQRFDIDPDRIEDFASENGINIKDVKNKVSNIREQIEIILDRLNEK